MSLHPSTIQNWGKSTEYCRRYHVFASRLSWRVASALKLTFRKRNFLIYTSPLNPRFLTQPPHTLSASSDEEANIGCYLCTTCVRSGPILGVLYLRSTTGRRSVSCGRWLDLTTYYCNGDIVYRYASRFVLSSSYSLLLIFYFDSVSFLLLERLQYLLLVFILLIYSDDGGI